MFPSVERAPFSTISYQLLFIVLSFDDIAVSAPDDVDELTLEMSFLLGFTSSVLEQLLVLVVTTQGIDTGLLSPAATALSIAIDSGACFLVDAGAPLF